MKSGGDKVEFIFRNRYMKKQNINRYKQEIGKWGESCASAYLSKIGFCIVDKNVRTPYGEIDLIAQQNEMTLFVEVKTRSTSNAGFPEEAITDSKFDRMHECADWYLDNYSDKVKEWRIDLITVIGRNGTPDPLIDWFQDAD
jgi:putative endonuclease